MGHANDKIQPPVNIREDIAHLCGRNTGDVGQLCGDVRWDSSLSTPAWVRAYGINPWALYKPIRENSWRMVVRTLNLHSLGFGDVPYASHVQGLLDLYGDSELLAGQPANGWHYLPPRGSAYNEQYRVYDFLRVELVNNEPTLITNADGYDKNAKNPFGTLRTPTAVAKTGGSIYASQQRTVPSGQGTSDTALAITDFNNILSSANKMLYYGILMVPQTSGGAWDTSFAAKLLCTTDSTDAINYDMEYRGHEILDLKPYLLTSNSTFQAVDYKVYPFLTNFVFSNSRLYDVSYANRSSGSAIDSGRRLFPIPGVTPAIITIYNFQIAVSVNATRANTLLETNVYYTVKNNTSLTLDLKFVLQWRKDSCAITTARRSGEVLYEWQNNNTDLVYYDDTHTAGAPASSAMATFLTVSQIAANAEVRKPGTGLTTPMTLPSSDVNTLIIGCYYNGTWQYGSVTVMVPATPGGQVLTGGGEYEGGGTEPTINA